MKRVNYSKVRQSGPSAVDLPDIKLPRTSNSVRYPKKKGPRTSLKSAVSTPPILSLPNTVTLPEQRCQLRTPRTFPDNVKENPTKIDIPMTNSDLHHVAGFNVYSTHHLLNPMETISLALAMQQSKLLGQKTFTAAGLVHCLPSLHAITGRWAQRNKEDTDWPVVDMNTRLVNAPKLCALELKTTYPNVRAATHSVHALGSKVGMMSAVFLHQQVFAEYSGLEVSKFPNAYLFGYATDMRHVQARLNGAGFPFRIVNMVPYDDAFCFLIALNQAAIAYAAAPPYASAAVQALSVVAKVNQLQNESKHVPLATTNVDVIAAPPPSAPAQKPALQSVANVVPAVPNSPAPPAVQIPPITPALATMPLPPPKPARHKPTSTPNPTKRGVDTCPVGVDHTARLTFSDTPVDYSKCTVAPGAFKVPYCRNVVSGSIISGADINSSAFLASSMPFRLGHTLPSSMLRAPVPQPPKQVPTRPYRNHLLAETKRNLYKVGEPTPPTFSHDFGAPPMSPPVTLPIADPSWINADLRLKVDCKPSLIGRATGWFTGFREQAYLRIGWLTQRELFVRRRREEAVQMQNNITNPIQTRQLALNTGLSPKDSNMLFRTLGGATDPYQSLRCISRQTAQPVETLLVAAEILDPIITNQKERAGRLCQPVTPKESKRRLFLALVATILLASVIYVQYAPVKAQWTSTCAQIWMTQYYTQQLATIVTPFDNLSVLAARAVQTKIIPVELFGLAVENIISCHPYGILVNTLLDLVCHAPTPRQLLFSLGVHLGVHCIGGMTPLALAFHFLANSLVNGHFVEWVALPSPYGNTPSVFQASWATEFATYVGLLSAPRSTPVTPTADLLSPSSMPHHCVYTVCDCRSPGQSRPGAIIALPYHPCSNKSPCYAVMGPRCRQATVYSFHGCSNNSSVALLNRMAGIPAWYKVAGRSADWLDVPGRPSDDPVTQFYQALSDDLINEICFCPKGTLRFKHRRYITISRDEWLQKKYTNEVAKAMLQDWLMTDDDSMPQAYEMFVKSEKSVLLASDDLNDPTLWHLEDGVLSCEAADLPDPRGISVPHTSLRVDLGPIADAFQSRTLARFSGQVILAIKMSAEDLSDWVAWIKSHFTWGLAVVGDDSFLIEFDQGEWWVTFLDIKRYDMHIRLVHLQHSWRIMRRWGFNHLADHLKQRATVRTYILKGGKSGGVAVFAGTQASGSPDTLVTNSIGPISIIMYAKKHNIPVLECFDRSGFIVTGGRGHLTDTNWDFLQKLPYPVEGGIKFAPKIGRFAARAFWTRAAVKDPLAYARGVALGLEKDFAHVPIARAITARVIQLSEGLKPQYCWNEISQVSHKSYATTKASAIDSTYEFVCDRYQITRDQIDRIEVHIATWNFTKFLDDVEAEAWLKILQVDLA